MIIHYDETIRFEKTDELNWNLERLVTTQRGDNIGRQHWKIISYHSTLGRACMCLAQEMADRTEAKSLREYAKELTDICADMTVRIDKAIRDATHD